MTQLIIFNCFITRNICTLAEKMASFAFLICSTLLICGAIAAPYPAEEAAAPAYVKTETTKRLQKLNLFD